MTLTDKLYIPCIPNVNLVKCQFRVSFGGTIGESKPRQIAVGCGPQLRQPLVNKRFTRQAWPSVL